MDVGNGMDQYIVVAIVDLLSGLSVIMVIWLFCSGPS